MKRSNGLFGLWGFALTTLCGTLLHFLYNWLGEAAWIAPFSGINESTWEHMKLLFWPMLLYASVQHRLMRKPENFWCIKLRGILLGLILIPILFYTYNGVIGHSPDWINIAIFFVSAAITFLYETRAFNSDKLHCTSPKFAVAMLCVIAALFIVFTFATPRIGIFKDPLTGMYGIT